MAPQKPKPNYEPNNPKKSGNPGGGNTPKPSKQFGNGQKQPHTDGRGQSGQPKR